MKTPHNTIRELDRVYSELLTPRHYKFRDSTIFVHYTGSRDLGASHANFISHNEIEEVLAYRLRKAYDELLEERSNAKPKPNTQSD